MAPKFLADENFNYKIVLGVQRRCPAADVVRLQDLSLRGLADPAVLELAVQLGRIVLTHDVNTMTRYGYQRIVAGLPMLGIIAVGHHANAGLVIEQLVLIIECGEPKDWENQVLYLPFK